MLNVSFTDEAALKILEYSVVAVEAARRSFIEGVPLTLKEYDLIVDLLILSKVPIRMSIKASNE